jgi:crotonobetainyl-CoA:carnitine CoA-transferase CaiB-like acyl-CoA transferase
MAVYNPQVYVTLHQGVKIIQIDLKSEKGQAALHKKLATTDILLTSFRPSALAKLGLNWAVLRKLFPQLSLVCIVGAPGARAEDPGHDLTYLADNGLIPGLELPPTLYADMGGSLMASEAVLQAALMQKSNGKGVQIEVALSEAAKYLALPRTWGLTLPKQALGGLHAGYRVYPCKDGRVAVAALEPHFAAALCKAAGVSATDRQSLFAPAAHDGIAAWLLTQTRKALNKIGLEKDIPLHTMA